MIPITRLRPSCIAARYNVRRVFAKRYTVTRLGLGWEGLILNLLYANPAIRFLPTPNPRPQPCDCSWVTWERLGTVLGLSCTPILLSRPFFASPVSIAADRNCLLERPAAIQSDPLGGTRLVTALQSHPANTAFAFSFGRCHVIYSFWKGAWGLRPMRPFVYP